MFPERLKEARKSKGLSQKEMAEKLFLSQQAYAKYEVGAAKPNTEMLTQIAAVLDVSIDYLLGIKTKEKLGTVVDAEDSLDSEILKHTAMLSRAEKEMLLAQLRGIVAARDKSERGSI